MILTCNSTLRQRLNFRTNQISVEIHLEEEDNIELRRNAENELLVCLDGTVYIRASGDKLKRLHKALGVFLKG